MFNKPGSNFNRVSKNGYPRYFEIKAMMSYFLSMPSPTKFYHVIQIVDVFMWPKFGNCSISMEKLSQPQFYKDLTRKTVVFEGWSWFKFNNLGLALSISLKFYSSVAKELKLKVRKFWELILTFIEVTREKLVGERLFDPYPE